MWFCITCQGATRAIVSSGTVGVGYTLQLSFTIYNHDGYQFDDRGNADWSSSNSSVSTFYGGGLVYGNSVGSATITANDLQVQDYDANLCSYGDAPDCGSVVGKGASATVTAAIPCFAQLKYRPVFAGLGSVLGNHSFWWIQDNTNTKWVIDGGPSGSCLPNCGYLNAWVRKGNTGYYSQDNSNDNLAWSSAVSPSLCGGAGSLWTYGWYWPQTLYNYSYPSPNSNTFAHLASNYAGLSPTTPPNCPGW